MILNFFIIFSYIENNPEKVRKILQGILAGKQFAGLKQAQDDILAKMLKAILDNKIVSSILETVFRMLISLRNLFTPQSPFLYVFLIIILTVIIFYVYKFIRQKISKTRMNDELEKEKEFGSIDPVVREKQGFTAAESGDFTVAIRHLYISLLLFLNTRGILEFRLSRTNRETEKILGDTDSKEFLDNFAILNRMFEEKIYALYPCSPGEFHKFKEAYDNCRGGLSKI